MSPFWIILELRMMEVKTTTGAMICAKLHSNRHHSPPTNQYPAFYKLHAPPVALTLKRQSILLHGII